MQGGRNRAGRPLKFGSVEELQGKIDDYFASTPANEVTITGLALHLDTSRSTLMDYEGRPEFSNAVKRAKDRVQLEYEKDLRRKGRSGDIFALKNFGWRDDRGIDHTTGGKEMPIPLLAHVDAIQRDDGDKEGARTEGED